MDHRDLAMALIKKGMDHYFSGGGNMADRQSVSDNTTTGGANGGIEGGFGSIANIPGQGPIGKGINNTTGNVTSATMNGVGGIAQGIGAAFTDQNQYNAQLAPTTLNNYNPMIQYGINQQASVGNQQGDLANALRQQALGYGPNPAASMLTQAQGQNAAQSAGVYANNRAINPALAARQASMLQAQTNQNASNNAATLRAQQQLAAQGQLGQNLQNQQGNNLAAQGQFLGAASAQNTNQVQNYADAQGINAQIAQNNVNAVNKTTGGFLGGAGSLLGSLLSKGGYVPNYDDGGSIPNYGGGAMPNVPEIKGAEDDSSGGSSKGGSGGGLGSMVGLLALLKNGGKVPGKATVSGDSVKNDTVPALVSPGEIVIPRTSSTDPEKAKEFIDHLMKSKKDQGGYGGMLQKHRELASRISELEKRLGKKAA